jgi:tripartite-type tricarboxylate transporter receptor subunit TctC
MIQFSRKGLLLAAASLCLGLVSAPAVASDNYPSKPIKLVVGFPPGGPTDIVGRVIGHQLSKELGQPVVVENNGGAGGLIGASNVAKAKPDGYTLLVSVESSNTRAAALNPSVPYDQEKSFTYIRKIAKQRNLVVANPKLPVSSIAELVAYLKAHPGEVNYGGTFGATSHIGGTLFDMANGTKMTFINYSGGAQPITDTIAGVVQVGFFTEATVAQHIKAGTLKVLAVASSERSPAFPDLPTVEQAGGRRLDISPWFGIAGPAKLPPEIVAKIGAALDRAAENKEFLAQLDTLGAVPVHGSTPESYSDDVGQGVAFWNKWAKEVAGPLAR